MLDILKFVVGIGKNRSWNEIKGMGKPVSLTVIVPYFLGEKDTQSEMHVLCLIAGSW